MLMPLHQLEAGYALGPYNLNSTIAINLLRGRPIFLHLLVSFFYPLHCDEVSLKITQLHFIYDLLLYKNVIAFWILASYLCHS